MIDPRVYTLIDSRGDVVLTASTRELDHHHEYWLTKEPDTLFGGSTMRAEDLEAPGIGDYPARATPSAKSIELRLRIHLPSHAACLLERMRLGAALADGEMGELVMSGGGLPRMRVGVERRGAVLTSHVAPSTFDFSVVLKAPDPRLRGDVQSVTVLPAGSGIGLVFPLFAPAGTLSYGAPSEATAGVLTNTGTFDAWPIYWPRGAMPSGFRIWQDGHPIEWAGPVSTGVPVAVDTARSAVEITGTDRSELLYRDDFQPIRPGASARITFEPLGGGSGYLEATLAPTYI